MSNENDSVRFFASDQDGFEKGELLETATVNSESPINNATLLSGFDYPDDSKPLE